MIPLSPVYKTVESQDPVYIITDGNADSPVALDIGLNPIQNLHGYEYPWVGGTGKNLFDISTVTTGAYIGSDGTIASSQYYQYTALIPVTEGNYIFSAVSTGTATGSSTRRIHGYDANGDWVQQLAYLTQVESQGDAISIPFTVPSGISYVRVSTRINEKEEQVEYVGGNLFTSTIEQGTISNSSGAKQDSTTRVRSKDMTLLEAGTYQVSATGATHIVDRIFDTNGDFVKTNTPSFVALPYTVAITEPTNFMFVLRKSNSSATITPSEVSNVRIDQIAPATSYMPYENICPFDVYSEANVTRTAKNLFDKDHYADYYITETGEKAISTATFASDYIPVEEGKQYTYSGTKGSASHAYRIHAFDESKNWIGQIDSGSSSAKTFSITFTAPERCKYVTCNFRPVGSSNMQLEEGSSKTDYDSSIHTYTVSFGGSDIYLGTVKFYKDGSCKLTNSHILKIMDGTTSGQKFSSKGSATTYDEYYLTLSQNTYSLYDTEHSGNVSNANRIKYSYLCSHASTTDASAAKIYANLRIGSGSNGIQPRLRFSLDMGIDTVEKVNQFLKDQYDNGTPVCYILMLKEPVEYDFTISEIESLHGKNIFWAGTGKITSLNYQVDEDIIQAEYDSAIKSDASTHAKITFIGQDIVLEDEDIDSSGVTLNDYLNGETTLRFGRAVSRELNIPIINSSKLNGIIWNSELKYEVGVEINQNRTEWITVGYFIGNRPQKTVNVDVIEFSAMDKMQKFDILADSWLYALTYPMTVWQMFTSLCDYVGVGYTSGDELPNMKARSFSSAPIVTSGMNCKEILSSIAEALGCYAKINADGDCQMVWFSDHTSEYTLTGDDEFSISSFDNVEGKTWADLESYKWEDLESVTWASLEGTKELFRIHALSVKWSDDTDELYYPHASNGNTYYIIDNPFLKTSSSSDINNYVKPIFDRLSAFGGYIPTVVNALGNCLVETGDIINVTSNGVTYPIPVFIKRTIWNGSCTDSYECTGDIDDATTLPSDVKVLLNESGKNREIILAIGNKYDKISGIAITNDGIEIEGNKFVKIKSGGVFTVESGNFNIDSNGNVYMKGTAPIPNTAPVLRKSLRSGLLRDADPDYEPKPQGATFTTESGNFSIDSTGNVQMKGDVEISADKSMTVKSGGNFSIESGGNININASGTFDVNSTNFKVNSSDRLVSTGNWEFNRYGLFRLFKNPTYGYYGNYVASYEDIEDLNTTEIGDGRLAGLSMYTSDNPNINSGAFEFSYQDFSETLTNVGGKLVLDFSTSTYGSPKWELFHSDLDLDNVYIFASWVVPNIAETSYLGRSDRKWKYAYIETVYQNSSRDEKHDIEPLEDMGETIDNLEPVSFVYDDDPEEKKRFGLVYEDTIDVLPDICSQDESAKAINYTELIPVLLAEIKSLRQRVKELEERMN